MANISVPATNKFDKFEGDGIPNCLYGLAQSEHELHQPSVQTQRPDTELPITRPFLCIAEILQMFYLVTSTREHLITIALPFSCTAYLLIKRLPVMIYWSVKQHRAEEHCTFGGTLIYSHLASISALQFLSCRAEVLDRDLCCLLCLLAWAILNNVQSADLCSSYLGGQDARAGATPQQPKSRKSDYSLHWEWQLHKAFRLDFGMRRMSILLVYDKNNFRYVSKLICQQIYKGVCDDKLMIDWFAKHCDSVQSDFTGSDVGPAVLWRGRVRILSPERRLCAWKPKKSESRVVAPL